MSELEKRVFRTALWAGVYLLASPVYLVLWALRLRRLLRGYGIVRQGAISCPYCGFANALNRLATCNRCNATEYGSLLFCSFCRQISRSIQCHGCGVTLRVFPGLWR